MASSNKSLLITDGCWPKLNLNDLGDDILVEIPYKGAFSCKFVSKRWNSRLSGPHFVPQFVSRWEYPFGVNPTNPRRLLLIPNLPSESLGSLGLDLETALYCFNFLAARVPKMRLQSDPEALGYSNGLLLLQIDHSDVNFVVFDKLHPRPQLLTNHYFKVGLVCDSMETVGRAALTKFSVVLASTSVCRCCNVMVWELRGFEFFLGSWHLVRYVSLALHIRLTMSCYDEVVLLSKAMSNSNKPLMTDSCWPKLNVDDMGDDILVEILHRLPYKQGFRCKFVSKRWNSLLSGPHFLRQFVSRWQYLFQHHDQHCSFVAIPPNPRELLLIPNLPSESLGLLGPNLETALSCFNFLPPSLPSKSLHSDQKVLGYSNGLLLLQIDHSDVNDFVVFDMITKQLIVLPLHPRLQPLTNHYLIYFQGGLVCDRTETVERDGATKFFVVLASTSMCRCCSEHELQMYSSETGQWKSLALWNHFTPSFVSAGVAHHGLLYFMCFQGDLVVCDPMLSETRLVCFPYYKDRFCRGYKYCIGVCCGALRLCQAKHFWPNGSGTMNVTVWELRGFDKISYFGSWHLVHDLSLGPHIGIGMRKSYYDQSEIEPRAFHPYNEEVLYFCSRTSILSLNLRRKTLEDIPVSGNADDFQMSVENTFQILIPCWPANA